MCVCVCVCVCGLVWEFQVLNFSNNFTQILSLEQRCLAFSNVRPLRYDGLVKYCKGLLRYKIDIFSILTFCVTGRFTEQSGYNRWPEVARGLLDAHHGFETIRKRQCLISYKEL